MPARGSITVVGTAADPAWIVAVAEQRHAGDRGDDFFGMRDKETVLSNNNTSPEKRNMTLNKILYVEDEPDLQALTKLVLEMLGGFTVKVCGSGAEALEQASAFAPDLFLLDMRMPGMDGPTTLQSLHAIPELAATPAIFMTAMLPDEIANFKTQGALGMIAKPFDPTTLADTIRTIWKQRHD